MSVCGVIGLQRAELQYESRGGDRWPGERHLPFPLMNAGEVARVVWRRKIIAVLVLVVVGASGTLFLSRQHKVYEASATIALLPNNSSVGTVSIYGDMVKNL